MVADYARISLKDVDDLDYFEYLALRRDAWIHKLNQTDQGREYLDNAYRLTLTEPDRGKLRDQFKKG